MTLFEEPFDDQNRLSRDWVTCPGMAVRNGVLAFAPDRGEGYCVGVTRQDSFRDFSVAADVRIVSRAVGLVLRAAALGQYYMVQFDIANNPSVVWFHTFTPDAETAPRSSGRSNNGLEQSAAFGGRSSTLVRSAAKRER